MFNFGFLEWIVIIAIAIVCIKPEDYPIVIKKCVRFVKKIETMWKKISNEIDIYDK